MPDYTISSTCPEDAYAIDMDCACISVDYDVANDMQYQLEQIAQENNETDILFE